jgi:hypothetical protein
MVLLVAVKEIVEADRQVLVEKTWGLKELV